MEIDSTIIKVQENNGQESEIAESDFILSKSTSKLIKICLQCIGALVQHIENAVSKSNGLIFINNSSRVKSNDSSDIDIVEHSVKHDPDDASRHIRSVKKCILQLCLLCVEQNIYVNCDLSFIQIDFYGCLDDSTRSLVINYLTENIVYMIEHIGFIISMFNQENNPEEARNIRKSLQKIYKQILLIPLNPNLDETPEVFQNLNNSQWYSESMQHLGEKLSLLRTSLIKFKKVLKKIILNSNYSAENIDTSSTKRKPNRETNQPSPKRMKHESNGLYSSDNVFRIPDIPPIHKSDIITVESDTERKKKGKHKDESETNLNGIGDVVRIESDLENDKKKKKHRVQSEMNENNVVTIESDTESVKKKKKHRIKSEINENNVVTIESDTESVKKKKKHIKSEINENNVVTVESDTESVKKKKKHKNDSVIIDSDAETLKNKKKYRQQSKTNGNETSKDIVEEESEFKRKDKKHKEQETNGKIYRNKTISESSDISIGKLFTSQLEIGDEDLTLSKTDNDLKNSKKNKKKKLIKDGDHNLSNYIFNALSNSEVEVLYEDEAENVYRKYVKANDLSENEKFLYLQDLILETKENKDLTAEMKEKLKNLTIMVNWQIPPIHQVERRLTSGPLPKELKELEILGVCNKRFSREEDITIRKNFTEFCKLHDMEQDATPFLMMRHGNHSLWKFEERRKFVQFLGKGLDNRALNSIYRRFQVLFRDKKDGRFNQQEDELILTYCKKISTHQHRFAALATILNRNRPAIERRYKTLTREFNERIQWNLQLETDLVNGLLESIGSKDVQDLKHVKLNADHYNQVGDAMRIPGEKIRNQWLSFIYTKLFAEEPLHPGNIRTQLIKLLATSGETDRKKINWDKITSNFKGFSKEFLWYQFLIAQQVLPKKKSKNFGKILIDLKDYMKSQQDIGKKLFSKKIIQRYRMTENGLKKFE